MIWFQYFAKPSRTAPLVVMLPTNFSSGSVPPVPVDALLDALVDASPPPTPVVAPPELEVVVPGSPELLLVAGPTPVVVLALELLFALLLELVLALVLPAPPEPPTPSSTPSPPSPHPMRVAIPSASQAVLHSNREERFLFMLDFRKPDELSWVKLGARTPRGGGTNGLSDTHAVQLATDDSRRTWK
ncbi:hypothetical protein [Sorangium sp. So ce204]|uniref:hypothetical protein n=1 Tax=Sorangium sp. So ce204 TaxID=3133288 RepID=UPI003F618DF1